MLHFGKVLLCCIVSCSIFSHLFLTTHLKIDILLFLLNLKDGLQNITEKGNNPTCYWNGCNAGKFNSLSELLKHVDSEHAFHEDQSTSALNDKKYKCKWVKCSVEFPQKTEAHWTRK